jgi:multidrug efflux pump subunit AcrA (membrane-fusion protein)
MSPGTVLVRYGVPVLAVSLLGFTAWSVSANYSPHQMTAPVMPAPVNPYGAGVAASGIVEPASEAIAIGIERGGVVSHVDVAAGDRVKAGQALFGVDDRLFEAAAAQRDAAVAAARAALDSAGQSIVLQKSLIAEAAANVASSKAESMRAALDRVRYGALARDSWASRQRLETANADAGKAAASTAAAQAGLAAAEQQDAVLVAQRAEAAANLVVAQAALQQARVDLERTVVRAPIDGTVLKVNVRPGEYAQTGTLAAPLMTMGKVDPLHIRTDIDDMDSWRVCPDSVAMARLRGNPAITVPLSFVRFEPYVVPKRSLTDDTAERVDTRVLQVIYAFDPAAFPVFVGQQVDVFIKEDAPVATGGGAGDSSHADGSRCGPRAAHPEAVTGGRANGRPAGFAER